MGDVPTDMSEANDETELEPLVQPRLIRLLKERRRLIDKGVREDFWENLEQNAISRRRPDTVAEKAVQNLFHRVQGAGGQTAKKEAVKVLNKANEGPLNKL